MKFFEQKQLFRIEITKKCTVVNGLMSMISRGYLPSLESSQKGSFGFIPIGIKGWVVKKWFILYFYPDQNQNGLDLFTPAEQPLVLIPYRKIKDYCKRI